MDTPLSDADLDRLAGLTGLKRLDVGWAQFLPPARQGFARRLPGCQVRELPADLTAIRTALAIGAVGIAFGKDGVRASASEDGSNAEDLPVEYDGERFVGKEEDTFVHPVPGEPRVRRAATAVIAERIAQALAEKYLR